jgi:hypothetical protein
VVQQRDTSAAAAANSAERERLQAELRRAEQARLASVVTVETAATQMVRALADVVRHLDEVHRLHRELGLELDPAIYTASVQTRLVDGINVTMANTFPVRTCGPQRFGVPIAETGPDTWDEAEGLAGRIVR